MTEGERAQEKLAAAHHHPDYARAMATAPPTWLGLAIVIAVVMTISLIITFAIYPWTEMGRMPAPVRAALVISWVPTLGAALASGWLLIDAIALASAPTRRVLAVVENRVQTPGPYYLRLITEDGADREYRARRRAASVVKLHLLTPGDVGVAVFKGDTVLEWVALPPTPGRTYDRT